MNVAHLAHLARRFAGSLSRREPAAADTTWVEGLLLPDELVLWRRMDVADRRHAITVARRFQELGNWSRAEMAGALLHDVGKLAADLPTRWRVVATVIGPRTSRFRLYHDHEQIGAQMLTAAGSAEDTVELARGAGRAADALRRADAV